MKKKKSTKRIVPNRGTRFVEGQAREYIDPSTAMRAHDIAVCKGFCYSTVVEDRKTRTFTLFVRGGR